MASKKNTLQNVTIIPASVANEAGRLMSRQDIESLPFWGDLTDHKRELLLSEIKQLAAAKMMHVSSGLAMGKHLQNIYDTCENYSGAFRKIASSFGFSERTAYRYMKTYSHACQMLPEQVVKAAMVRGLDVLSYNEKKPLGKYTYVMQHLLPPPRNLETPGDAMRYLDQVEQTYKDQRRAVAKGEVEEDGGAEAEEIQRDPEFLLKQNFRGIKNALTHVPSRQRKRWFERLVGMSLQQLGVASSMTFQPEAVPEEFKQGPGRPSNPRPVHEAVA